MLEFSEQNTGRMVVVSVMTREIGSTCFIILVLIYKAGLVE